MMRTVRQFKGVRATDHSTPTSTQQFITYKPQGTVQTTPTTSELPAQGKAQGRYRSTAGTERLSTDRGARFGDHRDVFSTIIDSRYGHARQPKRSKRETKRLLTTETLQDEARLLGDIVECCAALIEPNVYHREKKVSKN